MVKSVWSTVFGSPKMSQMSLSISVWIPDSEYNMCRCVSDFVDNLGKWVWVNCVRVADTSWVGSESASLSEEWVNSDDKQWVRVRSWIERVNEWVSVSCVRVNEWVMSDEQLMLQITFPSRKVDMTMHVKVSAQTSSADKSVSSVDSIFT